MARFVSDEFRAFVFKNRGLLLTIPAIVLAIFGKPSAFSIAIGLPVALLGELVRVWAVGYSGVTTRGDRVEAPELVSAGPYGYVRNPLYVGNFITALGFAIAFTGNNDPTVKLILIAFALLVMIAVYAIIIPHEEQFLRSEFGDAFDRYCESVPPLVPQFSPMPNGNGIWKPDVIAKAETRTFVTFAVMLVVLAFKAFLA